MEIEEMSPTEKDYLSGKEFIGHLLTAINDYRQEHKNKLKEPNAFSDNDYSFGVETAINLNDNKSIEFYFGKFKKGRNGFQPIENKPSIDVWFENKNVEAIDEEFLRKLEIIAADWKFQNGTYISNVSNEGGAIWFWLSEKHFQVLNDKNVSDETAYIKCGYLLKLHAGVFDKE